MDLVGHYINRAAPPSAFKNQAGTRAMTGQAPLAICEVSFGGADPATASPHSSPRIAIGTPFLAVQLG